MQDPAIVAAIVVGVALVLATIVWTFGRLKIEQQRTLQRLLEQDETTREAWTQLIGPGRRADNDRRRGLLLVSVGGTLSVILFLMGGIAWMLGAIPVVVGAVYLMFWRLGRDADRG